MTSLLGTILNQSTYAVTMAGGYLYYSGYSTVTYKYNPSASWTLTSANNTTCTVGTPSNPCIAAQTWGKYQYYSGLGSDGQRYLATSNERQTAAGGNISWINPTNNSTSTYRNGPPAITRYSPRDFARLHSGAAFAYSSNADTGSFGCTNTVGQVFIFTVASQSVTATYTPVAGSGNQGKVVETRDGYLLGLIQNYPSTGQYTVYKVNESTGAQVSWSPETLSGSPFGSVSSYDQQLLLGPDGAIWLYDAKNIWRINSGTGAVSIYASLSGVTRLAFLGNDLYAVAGSNLYWIPSAAQ